MGKKQPYRRGKPIPQTKVTIRQIAQAIDNCRHAEDQLRLFWIDDREFGRVCDDLGKLLDRYIDQRIDEKIAQKMKELDLQGLL